MDELIQNTPEYNRLLHDEKERLKEALKLNEPLAKAYYLKEDLRQLWEQEGYLQASQFLNDWIARARSSGVRMLHQPCVHLIPAICGHSRSA